jgi:hypothetical protein
MTDSARCRSVPSARDQAWQIALRVLLATALVIAVAKMASRDIVAFVLPGLTASLVWVAEDFEVKGVEFVKDRNDAALATRAMLKRTVFLGGRAVVPDGEAEIYSSTTLGLVLQGAFVALVLVLAWPAGLVEWLVRLAIATALIALLMFIDAPLTLAAGLWKSMLMVFEPGRTSVLVAWRTFLNGGGRLALGLVAGAIAIALARGLMERIERGRRT